MQRLEVSGAVRPIYGSLGVKRLKRPKCIGTDEGSNPLFIHSLHPVAAHRVLTIARVNYIIRQTSRQELATRQLSDKIITRYKHTHHTATV